MTVRCFFRVCFDGTAYHGWQRQAGDPTVQETLEQAFSTVCRQPCAVVGAGRTDAGVHARRLGAHVDLAAPQDLAALERSVNGVLPEDIAVSECVEAPEGFHARFSAVQRHYRYHVVQRKSPLCRTQAWQVWYDVDWELVRRNLAQLEGTHDFSTFQAAGSSVEEPVCTVSRACLEQREGQWVFFISANRFVYRMVRSIVGSAVAIGRGAEQGSLGAMCEAHERSRAGPTAPAHGLVLYDVDYPEGDR